LRDAPNNPPTPGSRRALRCCALRRRGRSTQAPQYNAAVVNSSISASTALGSAPLPISISLIPSISKITARYGRIPSRSGFAVCIGSGLAKTVRKLSSAITPVTMISRSPIMSGNATSFDRAHAWGASSTKVAASMQPHTSDRRPATKRSHAGWNTFSISQSSIATKSFAIGAAPECSRILSSAHGCSRMREQVT
jgi:hypothetical protein